MGDNVYKVLFLTGKGTAQPMGYPKFRKRTPPQDYSCQQDAVKYGVAKELPNIIRPLEEHSYHHIRNKQTFVYQVKTIRHEERS